MKTSEVPFTTDAKGRTAYYAWGIFGKGCFVETETQLKTLETHERITGLATTLIFGVAFTYFGILGVAIAAIPCTLWHALRVRSLTRGLIKTRKRLSFTEATDKMAHHYPASYIALLAVASLCATAFAVFLAVRDAGGTMNYIAVIVFGFCAIMSVLMLISKIRSR